MMLPYIPHDDALCSPALRVPPPVSAEGNPIEQPREKSFIEKYWMYMEIAVIAMCECIAPPLPRMPFSQLLTIVHLIRAQRWPRRPQRKGRPAGRDQAAENK